MVYKKKKAKKELSESKQKAQAIARICIDKKAQEVTILDMRKSCDFCDYFVILSADSERQIDSVAQAVTEELHKQKIRLYSNQGSPESKWVLLDYGDVIAHILHPQMRELYNLERLWHQAKRIRLPRHLKNEPTRRKKRPN